MKPVSKQPSRSYATRKTHKFNLLDEITIENLTFYEMICKMHMQCKIDFVQSFSDV